MRIAHISDIHCGHNWMYQEDELTAGIEKVNAMEPDIVIVTGDLTDWGLRDEMVKAKEFLDMLDAPYLVVPGNHDARYEGFNVFKELFKGHNSRMFHKKVDDILFIGMDSSQPDIDDGHLGREKTDWLERTVKKHDGIPMMFMHHHLLPVPSSGRERNILFDAGEILWKLEELKVPVVMNGHKHIPWCWNLNGMVVSTTGTLSCERTAWGKSFNMYTVKKNKFTVHNYLRPNWKKRDFGTYKLRGV